MCKCYFLPAGAMRFDLDVSCHILSEIYNSFSKGSYYIFRRGYALLLLYVFSYLRDELDRRVRLCGASDIFYLCGRVLDLPVVDL